MRRLLFASILALVIVPGCGTDAADSSAEFCGAVSDINDSLDTLTRTMLAANAGNEPTEFIQALTRTSSLFEANVARAPSGQTEPSRFLADAYAGFSTLMAEVDYRLDALPVDDQRAAVLTSDEFQEALISINEHCGAPS